MSGVSKGSTDTVAFKMEQNAAVVKLESLFADLEVRATYRP
jgi:hypothetical protein